MVIFYQFLVILSLLFSSKIVLHCPMCYSIVFNYNITIKCCDEKTASFSLFKYSTKSKFNKWVIFIFLYSKVSIFRNLLSLGIPFLMVHYKVSFEHEKLIKTLHQRLCF